MPSLQRTEAIARRQLITVSSIHIALDLTAKGDRFASTATISFTARPGGTTFVDFAGKRLLGAELNGSPLPTDSWRDGRIPLPDLAADNVLVVRGEMAYSGDGEGLHRHVDPADGRTYLYAMSFLDAAPRWFACFDQPDLKAPISMTVRAPTGWTVLGNGRFSQVEPGLWQLAPTPPLATYFVTLVAGPYASVLDEYSSPRAAGPIALGLHAKQSLADQLRAEAPDILEVTRIGLDAYHDLFAVPYPFGDYHQAFVPDFNAGAMENPGCVTLRDAFLFRGATTDIERGTRAGTITHELAHQWFGDLVTMRWWDDLWLNESFAEYLAHRVCADRTRYPLWIDFGINRKDWGSVADQAPSTHPVAGNGAADAAAALADFDGISYAKGAAVLRQLAAKIGDDVFLAGLRDYIDRYAYGNAELGDLLLSWARAGAGDLGGWADAWLRTSGLDTLSASPDGTLQRRGDTRREHDLAVAALAADGTELDRRRIRLRGADADTGVLGSLVVPDAGDETWASVRVADGLAGLSSISAIKDPQTRVVLWNSIRDSVRNAELDPAIALDRVLADIADEPSDLILRAILGFAADQLAGPFAPIADRSARLARVAATAERVLAAGEPGSDRQLIGWQLLIRSSADTARLAGWLAGTGLPPGRQLDDELRWSIVTRLALLGDDSYIEPMLTRDRSAAALNHAARARAGRPGAADKALAFAIISEQSRLPAYELYATASGLFPPGQAAELIELAERWFATMPDTTRFRRSWALGQVLRLSFPVAVGTPELLEQARRTLRRTDLDPLVRRALTDGTDQLERVVRSIERYA